MCVCAHCKSTQAWYTLSSRWASSVFLKVKLALWLWRGSGIYVTLWIRGASTCHPPWRRRARWIEVGEVWKEEGATNFSLKLWSFSRRVLASGRSTGGESQPMGLSGPQRATHGDWSLPRSKFIKAAARRDRLRGGTGEQWDPFWQGRKKKKKEQKETKLVQKN